MNAQSSFSRKLAIALILCAVVGTEISYHFTLESRFDAIEQKLQQDTVAMRQVQDSLDALSSSKTETLAGLNKQVEALQSSVAPMGRTTREQTDALTQVRQEIASLQQAQNQQVDAQKKLSSGIAQLEKVRNDARIAAATPAPVSAPTPTPVAAVTPAPAPTPVVLPLSTPMTGTLRAAPANAAPQSLLQVPGAFARSSKIAMLPATPNTSEAADLPSDDVNTGETFRSVRALPVGSTIMR